MSTPVRGWSLAWPGPGAMRLRPASWCLRCLGSSRSPTTAHSGPRRADRVAQQANDGSLQRVADGGGLAGDPGVRAATIRREGLTPTTPTGTYAEADRPRATKPTAGGGSLLLLHGGAAPLDPGPRTFRPSPRSSRFSLGPVSNVGPAALPSPHASIAVYSNSPVPRDRSTLTGPSRRRSKVARGFRGPE